MGVKIAGGTNDDTGLVVGNAYDKYGSKNPVVRYLMRGFEEALSALVRRAAPERIHEVGCGEGYWVLHWLAQGIPASGCDVSAYVIDIARQNAAAAEVTARVFEVRSIYDLDRKPDPAELIVCCEVLEHVDNPRRALARLASIAGGYVLLSVPREPIWRLLNMARGKYLGQFGNTPGHVQHWSASAFISMVSEVFDVVEIRTPLPWTMVLARRRH
ncbi:class I SAM-dependent methyltransferase [Dyella sp. BiH032]|uniref:class I SAM-dependent methyltransferase n=1 Tax=Dyella sp. BiH032 TaxID=3075430 RepID=UPI00289382B6|nr:class I SAM-dependent methyltransferase [Dyella sp. BiH032]WNL45534.1 class I SAM-dependent methyltransferase [Dyella sp. BiH032]